MRTTRETYLLRRNRAAERGSVKLSLSRRILTIPILARLFISFKMLSQMQGPRAWLSLRRRLRVLEWT
jgi:hypothetical protein